jgi:beta-lactamase class A
MRRSAAVQNGQSGHRRLRAIGAATAAVGAVALLVVSAAPAGAARVAAANGTGRATGTGRPAQAQLVTATSICTSTLAPTLAAKLSADIPAALKGRVSSVALTVYDRHSGVSCSLGGSSHFDSASVVKVTILGALLHRLMVRHRYLTPTEVTLTTAMITRSDNNAASTLWAEVGRGSMQYFLDLIGMNQTVLGPGGFWGLTQITAHDEVLLLRRLTAGNRVLDSASRAYALNLMARVISSQRWGTPAGTPAGVTVHVKNGWLSRATHGWRIHSIGSFSGSGRDYMIVVLTQDNPTMAYGIATIENVARVIHRDLNAGAPAAIGRSPVSPLWGVSDESIPALPAIP